jgi:hypothetical protein
MTIKNTRPLNGRELSNDDCLPVPAPEWPSLRKGGSGWVVVNNRLIADSF